MADKTVARSIASAYRTTPEHILALYAALGDLGLVAEQLGKEAGRGSNGLRVDDVFGRLKTIAGTSGRGRSKNELRCLPICSGKLTACLRNIS
jgi:ATP-dependent DNA ligase